MLSPTCLCSLILLFIAQPMKGALHPEDRAVLEVLKAEWGTSWDLDDPLFCGTNNATTGVVIEDDRVTGLIDVGSGRIPAEIGNLSELTVLSLVNVNNFEGNIPSSLGALSKLEHLDLRNNALTGSIPNMFGGMPNLKTLNLSSNILTGRLPSSLASATSLTALHLDDNRLSGSIPSGYGRLRNLTQLDLSLNELTGTIPPSLGNLVNAQELRLSENHLRGPIPPSLGNLSSISFLDLSVNQLSGSIPGALSQLTDCFINLDYNFLSGTLPANLGEFGASAVTLAANYFNPVPESASWHIIENLGPTAPTIDGFDTQRENGVVIEGVDTNNAAAFGFDFVKRLTLRNQSPVDITGTLLVFANPALGEPTVIPAGEITLVRGGTCEVSFTVPTGVQGTQPGTYFYDISFEGSEWLFPTITVSDMPPPDTVASVSNLTGSGTVTRSDGVVQPLTLNTPLVPGDIVEISDGGEVTFTYIDETTMTLSDNALMVIDNYHFDPDTNQGEQKYTLLWGIIDVTSGLMDKIGGTGRDLSNIVIETPYCSCGIRGTIFTMQVTETETHIETFIDVSEGSVAYRNEFTGDLLVVDAGESHTDITPIPSLETVVAGVGAPGALPYGHGAGTLAGDADRALNLAGYTDSAFLVERSTDLKTWSYWQTVQSDELPLSLEESSSEGQVYYRLVR